MKHPLIWSTSTKRVFYKGTPNEQIVTYAPEITYAEIAINKVGWWLSKVCMVEEKCYHRSPCKHRRRQPKGSNHYSGSGLYMSIPQAHRLRWIWRGRSIYSLFWGARTHNHVSFELVDDRKRGGW